jgi:hypothetical protein
LFRADSSCSIMPSIQTSSGLEAAGGRCIMDWGWGGWGLWGTGGGGGHRGEEVTKARGGLV